ncbi:hypothetical protein [Pseudonocardia abyssalis]|uniref:Uncharacterized protein n=1 Tax=Pseudonocardia abyssalis TaxID=2792008 RepID=A0ABS6UTT2_9PSEU|nr:hypothetical protein [Pseudonocardia abyssalis]MBW0114355.1 hypothetical protein [Pseudonocardia abyssalis]MBW0135371.1 hypothetical protein [Pseudonocardia abyssalis]
MTRLDEIPTAAQPPVGATPSAVVAHIRSVRPSRRTVLRGLVIAAAAAALVPLDWYLARREAAAAQPSTEGDDMSEHMGCKPESYREEADNWPSTGTALCYGGWRRGGFPCSDGYHREGSYKDGPDAFESTRVTQSCHGRNAWRWNGYRCSDATTSVVYADGTEYRGITIAACPVPAGSPANTPAPEPAEESSGGTGSGRGEQSGHGDESGGGGSGRGEESGGGRSGSDDDESGGGLLSGFGARFPAGR